MDVFAEVERRIAQALVALQAEGALPADLPQVNVEAEVPRDPAHGDVASNVAMVLSKAAKMKPRDIAEQIAGKLASASDVVKVDVAGPGFLNITFKPEVWHALIAGILAGGPSYGRTGIGKSEKVNVEYVSANPTGPMHVGHCRGAVLGDSLANLLAFVGYDVTREYYINDAGGQVDMLARSAHLRYREALGETITAIPDGLYPGDYLVPVGAALAKEHGKKLLAMPEAQWLPVVREFAIAEMMVMIRADLAALDIKHDVFFSERSLTAGNKDEVKATIDALRAKGLVFEGRLPPPKGEPNPEWEDREQTLFKSTQFGDDTDRALLKSDGTYTYFAPDIAYHKTKWDRGFAQMIDVLGADHAGYKKRLQAAVRAVSDGGGEVDVLFCQLVRLFKNGEPFKMSKRAGTFVTLRDVVDEVGRDPVRFMMLYRKNDAPLDFDFAKVVEQSKENPVFYVQMAHARCCSAFRNANVQVAGLDASPVALAKAKLSLLIDPGELELMRRLADFPRIVNGAARAHEPHRLAFYLYELASTLHQQWTRGNDSPHLRFTQPDDATLTVSRLALVGATKQVISSGLGILGVHAPDELR
jgi:arginyl-tRNA synthetase